MTPLVTRRSAPGFARDQKALDRVVVGGLAWTAGVKWLSQIVTWGITLIVARLLTPADYGLVGMAAVFLGLITLFSEFGIGVAVITFHDLEHAQFCQLHTVSILLGILSFFVCWGFAAPLGLFFHSPKLPLVVLVTALGFIVVAYRTVPYALLQRDMRFKLLAFLEGVQTIAQATSTLVLAVLGFGYWALVIGGLVGTTVSSALPFIYEPLRFALPRWKSIGRELVFSWHVITGRLYFYAYDNADMLIVGRVLGEGPLGSYSMGYTLAHMPVEKFTTLINRVTPSLFSAVKNDLVALRRYLRNLTQAIALVIFPAGVGTALVAPEFVHLVLGKKWMSAIVPLQLLALYACFRAIRTLLSPLLNAVGEPQVVMRNNLLILLVLPACFYIGTHWGTTGVAACWVVLYPLLSFSLLRAALERLEMRKREYFYAIWPALSSIIPMGIIVVLLKWALPHGMPLYGQFATQVFAGIVVYSLMLLVFHRERLRSFYQLRKLLAKAG
jgi:teichuronic acid exporter